MKLIKRTSSRALILCTGALMLGSLVMCKNGDKSGEPGSVMLLGAGSSFVNPLYTKMFSEYNQKTGVKVNYQSVGSGAGIQQLTSKTVDFGASDAYLNDEKMAAMPAPIIHIPTCLGAVVITYNIPGVTSQLNLNGDVIASIYLGKIKKWNDPALVKLNPDAKLPGTDIIVVHRSDGSGTTFIFADYLAKISEEWKTSIGVNTSLNWPAGLGGKGSEGVSGLVKQTPGAIGYVELIYALQNNIGYAKVINKSGSYAIPSLQSVVAAGNVKLPDDLRFSITNSESSEGYPISGASWVMMYKEQKYGNRTLDQATTLAKLVWWMIHEGQSFNEPLNYAKLPASAVTQAEALLKSVTYDGKQILQ